MNKLTFETYKDKVKACWLGKNIGGTLGAPFECIRGVYDIEYYTHDLSLGVLPNDDLDLQLLWLNAAEKYGKEVNADILGEYWISYEIADWSEYGAGKNNMKYGIQPPISGWYKNHNKDSCGCFIRSEIWACLAPGHPEIAVKYAYEDAICDHSDEGMYAEIFCAALESAAFTESDMNLLVDTALSFIPESCDIAKVVKTATECRNSNMDWKEARKVILQKFPGSFGLLGGYKDQKPEDDVPQGKLGYDAPSNIGIMMLGWLYGEGDFSKSICIAAGCCEDGDCTAGTLGSILGIIGGTKIIDEKWLAPIGDEIKTISIDMTKECLCIPKTVTELTDRVIRLMPVFMHGYTNFDDEGRLIFDGVESFENATKTRYGVFDYENFADRIALSPVRIRKSSVLANIELIYDDESMNISAGIEKKFRMRIYNNLHSQQWFECKLSLPEDWSMTPSTEFCVNLNQRHGGCAITEMEFSIIPGIVTKGRYSLTMEISSNGRLNKIFIPITLLAN